MKSTRRQLLRGTAVAGAGLFAGCLTSATDEPEQSEPDDTPASTCRQLDLPRVDEPPHAPSYPAVSQDETADDTWTPHYLGTGLSADSDLKFTQADISFAERIADPATYTDQSVVYAERIESEAQLMAAVTDPSGPLTDVDFDTQFIIAILSGFGSSALSHEWKRVTHSCNEIHLHGYYSVPYLRTDDYTSQTSAVIVDRPTDMDTENVWISLTTAVDTRVNWKATGQLQTTDQ